MTISIDFWFEEVYHVLVIYMSGSVNKMYHLERLVLRLYFPIYILLIYYIRYYNWHLYEVVNSYNQLKYYLNMYILQVNILQSLAI